MRKPTSLIVGIIFTLFSVQASADFCEYRCWDYNNDSIGTYTSVFTSSDGLDHDLYAPGTGSNLFSVSNYVNIGHGLFVPSIKTEIVLPQAVYRPIVYTRNEGGDPFELYAFNTSGTQVGKIEISANQNILFPAAMCTDEPIATFEVRHESAEPLIYQICYLEDPTCE